MHAYLFKKQLPKIINQGKEFFRINVKIFKSEVLFVLPRLAEILATGYANEKTFIISNCIAFLVI